MSPSPAPPNGASILIVTSGALCRHPRVPKEAAALGAAGYAVTVLTVANSERFEAVDSAFLQGQPFRKISVDLLGRTWAGRASSFLSRGATWAARRAARRGLESPWALGPARALERRARAFGADLTIVHTETAFPAGRALLRRGRRVAADFEDWHSEDLLPEARRHRPLGLIRALEAALMHPSGYASTTSNALAAALQDRYGGRLPVVIRNAFPLQPDPAPAAVAGSAPALEDGRGTRPTSLLWFSQTIGPGRMLEQFLDSWALTEQPSRLSLLGDVDPAYRSGLLARLPEGRRDRLSFLPLVPPDALPAVIARHSLGLALEPRVPANKNLTISNKILQYLNAGVGVVATGTDGQREVLADAPGAGLLVDLADPAATARQLDSVLADPPALCSLGRAARRAAEATFCWERQAPVLLGAVAEALRAAPASTPPSRPPGPRA